ncbi:NAD(P)-binding protein [Coniochaeta ligniaria NRRL 30616]|uniref:NAD(P)-binding protein n=1 Tax=Coniochaeta ligniaria NRRL 30616 TaxID=1408157 RepID=A0A1J7JNF5_9PEZI|nr:NAD(P)-binding protein [Coniochaeta ligniaria NRRL 30616]
MALLERVTDQELSKLKGKSVIITGGGGGIGKSAACLAHAAGANVTIADLGEDMGEALINEFKERILYVKTDVTSWPQVLNLFTKAWDHFGSIDVVISNAGTHDFETLLDEDLTEDGTLAAPSLKSIEVNLHAAAYCAKAALHFFKKQPEKSSQLVFTGSAASIIDTPPLFLYCAGKAGVLGLMRGMRKGLPSDKITVNMIAPWMTKSPMMPDWIREKWGDLPANEPDGVASALLLPALRPELNGKTLWVAGNDVIEIEDALDAAKPQWLGTQLSADVDEGQRRMGISS